jgi:CDP-diacylglycerol--glycerol-3-phosphate 3-phosphatidyltransferase
MPTGARLAILAHLALGAATALAYAVVRPPEPARFTGRRGIIGILGRWAYFVSGPLLRAANATGLTANGVTAIGTALTAAAGVAVGLGGFGWAFLLLVYGSWCDLLDGELARRTGTQTKAGAFLDSNLDRVSEMAMFGGLAAAFPNRAGMLWAVGALSASMMVSYTRARGEGLGVSCPTFGLERPHRVVMLMAALLAASFVPAPAVLPLLETTCALVALGAGGTALGRLWVIHQMLRHGEGAAAGGAQHGAPGAPPAGTP